MKSDTTNTVLIFLLGIFAALDVLFAVRAVNGSRELRSLQIQASQAQMSMIQLQQFKSLVADTQEYNRKSPNAELARILGEIEQKPAAH